MHYSVINPCDMVNGEGVRVSLFVSGCSFNCPGCFNKEAQNYKYGQEFTNASVALILKYLLRPNISGLSILGGEPLNEKNKDAVYALCHLIKQRIPNKTIWIWTGNTYEELVEDFPEILEVIDVLIDGRYMEGEKTVTLPWRGSSNQRMINVKETKLA